MTATTKTPSLKNTKRAAQAPSKGTSTKAADPIATLAATVTTKAPTPEKKVAVALRGGLAVTSVKLTGKNYRVGCDHNAQWWKQCEAACAKGPADVKALVESGVPAIFVGYVIRRGYLAAA